VVRAFFGRMAVFLMLSGLADSYAAGPVAKVLPGNWFDLVWSLLLAIPLVIAATWKRDPSDRIGAPTRAQTIIVNEFFPLLYPFFSLLLLSQIAQARPALASSIVLLSFSGVGVRTLMIQHRLLRAQQELLFKAAHDPLTNLWNHGTILDLLQQEIERHQRNAQALGMMMIDLDYFKKVNDSYGHLIGDLVLQEVAFRLSASVRSYDSLGRYGGEEFLVILPGCGSADLTISGERLRTAVAERPIETAQGAIPVTISVGMVCCGPGAGADPLNLLRLADAALYEAKKKGRNRVEQSPSPTNASEKAATWQRKDWN
jgi:diguanylate cyclase (GGDEF)-like protein